MTNAQDLLYTWNDVDSDSIKSVEIEDDTLRDGLQGAFVKKPTIEQKIELLLLAAEIGVQGAVLGFPASSPQELSECRRLVRAIEDSGLKLTPRFLGRARVSDLEPIVALHEEASIDVSADFYIGTSPMRRFIENWELKELIAKIEEAGAFIRRASAPFTVAIEDATRTPPDDLREVVKTIVNAGAYAVCVGDTVGDSTPDGAARIVEFIREVIDTTGTDAKILWHGHNDRGLALANSLAAAHAGADIIGGSFLGIGERAGNTSLEQVILYLYQHGVSGYRIDPLVEYCRKLAEYTDTPIPDHHPLVGAQSFATCTGTHSAAILKARGHSIEHEDYVFSSVPASQLGRPQEILIGPTSGQANARYMLERLNLSTSEADIQRLLGYAKTKARYLKTEEITEFFSRDGGGHV